MQEIRFTIDDLLSPRILAADKDYVLAYKPPFMHSAPVRSSVKENFLDWCCVQSMDIALVNGRGKGEGGLLHRLDHETHGLMLLARTEAGFQSLLAQQKDGSFVKEYSALAAPSAERLPGFPETAMLLPDLMEKTSDCVITTGFRPYGPGRKAVRPLIPEEGMKVYFTGIISMDSLPSGSYSFRLRLVSGFRHQIRCHLAWLGMPLLDDRLYGGREDGKVLLALRADSLSFDDPGTGERIKFSMQEIDDRE